MTPDAIRLTVAEPRGLPERCTLMGCTAPTSRHHHHWLHGHLNHRACSCPSAGQPGAEPRQENNHV